MKCLAAYFEAGTGTGTGSGNGNGNGNGVSTSKSSLQATASPASAHAVCLLQPTVHEDARGQFLELYNPNTLAACVPNMPHFVQDNLVHSTQGVLRGMHLQCAPAAQGKLVHVLAGTIYDVVVDVRAGSPSFGQWQGFELCASQPRLLWVPPGFAHGYLVLSPQCTVLYKVSAPWSAAHERTLAWNDPSVAIAWPLQGRTPLLSAKDENGLGLSALKESPCAHS